MQLDQETDKKVGSILAAFVGDSIGSFNEGVKGVVDKKQVDSCMNLEGGWGGQLASGQVTDDSELAMC